MLQSANAQFKTGWSSLHDYALQLFYTHINMLIPPPLPPLPEPMPAVTILVPPVPTVPPVPPVPETTSSLLGTTLKQPEAACSNDEVKAPVDSSGSDDGRYSPHFFLLVYFFLILVFLFLG